MDSSDTSSGSHHNLTNALCLTLPPCNGHASSCDITNIINGCQCNYYWRTSSDCSIFWGHTSEGEVIYHLFRWFMTTWWLILIVFTLIRSRYVFISRLKRLRALYGSHQLRHALMDLQLHCMCLCILTPICAAIAWPDPLQAEGIWTFIEFTTIWGLAVATLVTSTGIAGYLLLASHMKRGIGLPLSRIYLGFVYAHFLTSIIIMILCYVVDDPSIFNPLWTNWPGFAMLVGLLYVSIGKRAALTPVLEHVHRVTRQQKSMLQQQKDASAAIKINSKMSTTNSTNNNDVTTNSTSPDSAPIRPLPPATLELYQSASFIARLITLAQWSSFTAILVLALYFFFTPPNPPPMESFIAGFVLYGCIAALATTFVYGASRLAVSSLSSSSSLPQPKRPPIAPLATAPSAAAAVGMVNYTTLPLPPHNRPPAPPGSGGVQLRHFTSGSPPPNQLYHHENQRDIVGGDGDAASMLEPQSSIAPSATDSEFTGTPSYMSMPLAPPVSVITNRLQVPPSHRHPNSNGAMSDGQLVHTALPGSVEAAYSALTIAERERPPHFFLFRPNNGALTTVPPLPPFAPPVSLTVPSTSVPAAPTSIIITSSDQQQQLEQQPPGHHQLTPRRQSLLVSTSSMTLTPSQPLQPSASRGLSPRPRSSMKGSRMAAMTASQQQFQQSLPYARSHSSSPSPSSASVSRSSTSPGVDSGGVGGHAGHTHGNGNRRSRRTQNSHTTAPTTTTITKTATIDMKGSLHYPSTPMQPLVTNDHYHDTGTTIGSPPETTTTTTTARLATATIPSSNAYVAQFSPVSAGRDSLSVVNETLSPSNNNNNSIDPPPQPPTSHRSHITKNQLSNYTDIHDMLDGDSVFQSMSFAPPSII
jgi:hypothetical protein